MYRLSHPATKFLLVIILSLNFFSLSCSNSTAEFAKPSVVMGERAPDFMLNDLNGNNVALTDFYGKKNVLLICTTTWCSHCITSIPGLKEIYSRYSNKGLEVMAMYVNESEDKVRTVSQKYGIRYTILLDPDGAVATLYKIRGVPTFMIIDKNGIMQYRGYKTPIDIIKEITG